MKRWISAMFVLGVLSFSAGANAQDYDLLCASGDGYVGGHASSAGCDAVAAQAGYDAIVNACAAVGALVNFYNVESCAYRASPSPGWYAHYTYECT